MSDTQKLLERKIKALKSIIYIKTHPSTVKKIFLEGYTNGERINFRGMNILLSLNAVLFNSYTRLCEFDFDVTFLEIIEKELLA